MQAPLVTIVGRPNVGKSTLFNCLTRSRNALVANFSGLTRDRIYGIVKHGNTAFRLVDTGGLCGNPDDIENLMQDQVNIAIEEAQLIIFLVDGSVGLTQGDRDIADQLRRKSIQLLVVANKSEATEYSQINAEFSELGLGQVHAISASHRAGINVLRDYILDQLEPFDWQQTETETDRIRIAIVGRPNVGKSTLTNRLLKAQRVVAYDMPGTTRDSIYIPHERAGVAYEFIDTAGIKRRAKVHEKVETFSIIKALDAINNAAVSIVVCDAQEGITDQDAHLIAAVISAGRALVIVLNKMDGLSDDQKIKIERELDLKLGFIQYARKVPISALHGTRVGLLWQYIEEAYTAAHKKISTSELNKVFESIISHHAPPIINGRTIRMRYAHIGGHNPPTILIHGNQLDKLPKTYLRYLENAFREAFNLFGTPLKLVYKNSENPFAGRKNKLSDRQQMRRKRLIRNRKKNAK